MPSDFPPKMAMKNWDRKPTSGQPKSHLHSAVGNSHSVLRFCTTDQKTIAFTVMHADFKYVSWLSDMRIVTGWWFGTFVIFPYIGRNME